MAVQTPQAISIPQKLKAGTSTIFHNGLIDKVVTQAGANDGVIQPLPSHSCEMAVLMNNTAAVIRVYRIMVDTVNYFLLNPGASYVLQGMNGNTSHIGVMRNDANGAQPSVTLQIDVLW